MGYHPVSVVSLSSDNSYLPFSDNPQTDIYGANLYNSHLERLVQNQQQVSGGAVVVTKSVEPVRCCHSILVQTGVYSKPSDDDDGTFDSSGTMTHHHRDYVVHRDLTHPTYSVKNVLEAVDLIFKNEDFL